MFTRQLLKFSTKIHPKKPPSMDPTERGLIMGLGIFGFGTVTSLVYAGLEQLMFHNHCPPDVDPEWIEEERPKLFRTMGTRTAVSAAAGVSAGLVVAYPQVFIGIPAGIAASAVIYDAVKKKLK